MTSDRMMQAIGRMERAISRLQTAAEKRRDEAAGMAREIALLDASLRSAQGEKAELLGREQALLERERERVAAEARQAELALPDPDPHAMNPFSHDKALAALRSLDALIDDLQKARRDG